MKFLKLGLWRASRTIDQVQREREAADRCADALKAASAHATAAKAELAAFADVNRFLRDENELLRARVDALSQLVGPVIAQERDEALSSRDSLASENIALIEKAEAVDAERTTLVLMNQQLLDENTALKAERKRVMADQWLLKQLNTDLQAKLEQADHTLVALPPSAKDDAGRARD